MLNYKGNVDRSLENKLNKILMIPALFMVRGFKFQEV